MASEMPSFAQFSRGTAGSSGSGRRRVVSVEGQDKSFPDRFSSKREEVLTTEYRGHGRLPLKHISEISEVSEFDSPFLDSSTLSSAASLSNQFVFSPPSNPPSPPLVPLTSLSASSHFSSTSSTSSSLFSSSSQLSSSLSSLKPLPRSAPSQSLNDYISSLRADLDKIKKKPLAPSGNASTSLSSDKIPPTPTPFSSQASTISSISSGASPSSSLSLSTSSSADCPREDCRSLRDDIENLRRLLKQAEEKEMVLSEMLMSLEAEKSEWKRFCSNSRWYAIFSHLLAIPFSISHNDCLFPMFLCSIIYSKFSLFQDRQIESHA
jgi:hypothetical protein